MNSVDPAPAFSKLLEQWGAPGAVIVLLIIAVGFLAWWLVSSYRDRLEEVKKDLSDKYKDAEDGRAILRELKSAIEANTAAMNATVAVLKGKV